MKAEEKLLEVSNLKKHYANQKNGPVVKAVDGVNFHVNRGETLGIVGESGSGKSTVAKMIMQLEKPTKGDILFHGKPITSLSRPEKRKLQIIFQDPYGSLNPRMRAKDIVTEPLFIHEKMPKRERYEKALDLLEEVGLGKEHLNRYPHQFSGGQRQRLSIARAIALKPDLIVCDEAVSALDVSTQAQILHLLDTLQKTYGIAYIFIAHGLPAVRLISDRIAIMYKGKIVETGSRDEIFENPQHDYTKTLLNAVPPSHPKFREEMK
ncbi:ABC transporter ATP-binding protein [Oceanobacillus luteolus]|uniref:ABC transporter ATP-binding protein n=1 Tax=Oceanobacillus luteolus TaxID=1274358 RepID=A0ABW4HRV0_9BACI